MCRLPVLSGGVDSTAASSAASATRASPPEELATRSSTVSETSGCNFANPLSPSASARSRMLFTSSAVSGLRTSTRQRDSSAPVTSKEGFSVVAPIKVTVPFSTAGNRASCCPLLKRWISSMKRIVRVPNCRSRRASEMAARRSLTPEKTAESATKRASAFNASKRASVVLPVPGAPQRINEGKFAEPSSRRRRIRPSPTRWSWPTNSESERGRIRSANGAEVSTLSSGGDLLKRFPVVEYAMIETSRAIIAETLSSRDSPRAVVVSVQRKLVTCPQTNSLRYKNCICDRAAEAGVR